MSEAFKRLLQAVRLQRDAFVWMDFNDRATGDAFIMVVLTAGALLIELLRRLALDSGPIRTFFGLASSASGLNLLFATFIGALIFWLAFAGIVLFVVRFLFQAPAKYPLLLRTVGFAYPTLLLQIFTRQLGLPALVAFLLGSVWFLLIVAAGVRYESELSIERTYGAVGLSIVLWVVVSAIFGRGFF